MLRGALKMAFGPSTCLLMALKRLKEHRDWVLGNDCGLIYKVRCPDSSTGHSGQPEALSEGRLQSLTRLVYVSWQISKRLEITQRRKLGWPEPHHLSLPTAVAITAPICSPWPHLNLSSLAVWEWCLGHPKVPALPALSSGLVLVSIFT